MTKERLRKLHKTVESFRRGMLGNEPSNWMCRAVCLPLQAYLSFAFALTTTLSEGVIINDDCDIHHTWLTLPDGKIIDPTADQFVTPDGAQMPAVYIGALPEWYESASGEEGSEF